MRSWKVTGIALLAATAALLSRPAPAPAGDGHDHGEHAKASAVVGKAAPDFELAGADGKAYKLSDYQGKYVVLEWNNPDCPFVRKHYNSGNMQALQKTYAGKDVVWLTICSSAPGKQGYYDGAELEKILEHNKFASTAYLRDTTGEVGRTYGAKTTPNMFVIDPKGTLIYSGAIDDKPSTKPADIDGATNYVSSCLDAAMAGKAVSVTSTTPYGCSVKYAD